MSTWRLRTENFQSAGAFALLAFGPTGPIRAQAQSQTSMCEGGWTVYFADLAMTRYSPSGQATD